MHVLLSCIMYGAEWEVLRRSVERVGREWGLQGVLGNGDGAPECGRALCKFLGDTGLGWRI